MKYRRLAPVLAIMLVFTIAIGTVWSMTSTSFQVPVDSFQGGGSGGGVSTSSGYRVEGSFGGAIQMWDTSASLRLCSGFVCLDVPYRLLLPLIQK